MWVMSDCLCKGQDTETRSSRACGWLSDCCMDWTGASLCEQVRSKLLDNDVEHYAAPCSARLAAHLEAARHKIKPAWWLLCACMANIFVKMVAYISCMPGQAVSSNLQLQRILHNTVLSLSVYCCARLSTPELQAIPFRTTLLFPTQHHDTAAAMYDTNFCFYLTSAAFALYASSLASGFAPSNCHSHSAAWNTQYACSTAE